MDTAQVEEAITAAIESPNASVIGILGDWGVGSSWLW
jgi:hypothetical protein